MDNNIPTNKYKPQTAVFKAKYATKCGINEYNKYKNKYKIPSLIQALFHCLQRGCRLHI